MKKLYVIAILFLLTSNAQAAGSYVGIDLQHNSLGVSTNNVQLSGGGAIKPNDKDFYDLKSASPSVYFGVYNESFAIEASYSYIKTDKTNGNTGLVTVPGNNPIASSSKVQIHNVGIDLKPYLSFDKIKVFGIIGANMLKANVTENLSAVSFNSRFKDSDIALGASLGAGAEYEFVKNWSARIQAKYTKTKLDFTKTAGLGSIDSILAVSAGLKYSF